jgi:hypothetical protein
MKKDFLRFIDSIDLGDRKIVVLVTSGRNGSNLLQSLFDSHSSVLMMPTLFWFYTDWRRLIGATQKISVNEGLNFLRKSSFKMDWYTSGLGSDRNSSIFIDRARIKNLILELVGADGYVTRKELLMMLHYLYGIEKYNCLDARKVVFFHHHFPFSSMARNYFGNGIKVNIPVVDELSDLIEDFPTSYVLHSIRNPYSAYLSGFDADHNFKKIFDIRQHFFQTLGLLSGLDLAVKRVASDVSRVKGGYYLVKYEDLHIKPFEILQRLILILGIKYEEILMKSTFEGKQWWGNNPAKPYSGTSPIFVKDIDVKKLARSVTSGLWDCLDKLAGDLGYKVITRQQHPIRENRSDMFFLFKLTRGWIYFPLIIFFSVRGYRFFFHNIIFLILYPAYWRKMISSYQQK